MGNIIHVGDEFRTNDLSHTPGGSTVHVVYKDDSVRIYTNVKYPKKYIETAMTNANVKNAYVVQ